MKVTYVGNTVRNGEKRKVTYTGDVAPVSAQAQKKPRVTYVGVDTSNSTAGGAPWHTSKNVIEANKKYFNPQESKEYNISALGAGNYGADKRPNSGYNYGKGALKIGGMGLTSIARTPTTILAQGERLAAKGWNALFGNIAPMNERGLFNLADEAIARDQEYVQEKYAENTEKGGKYAAKAEELGASAVEALTSLAVAYATGGTSAVMTADKLAAQTASKSAPAIVQTLSQIVKSRAKDPNYLTSAAQIYSHSYNDAKDSGVDEKRATLYALGNALLGSEIEVSGGIQKLPNNAASQAAWRTLVDTMVDEGKEEVLQGIIDRTLQNAVYDAENPYFGVNENAIFDPGTAIEEFAGGAIVGGLLSGGVTGVNALANRAAYNAAKAQYNRDVRQNTAPQMDSKTAQAVEAVTRGETISGNQAAAIAKDPVAVEALEQSTGVKLNTQQPIGQLKRDIVGLSSRSTAQTAQGDTSSPTVPQKRTQRAVDGFMEAGQKAYSAMRETAGSDAELYAGFASVYNAGLNGIDADKARGRYAAMLTPEQRYAAYNAGLEDAAAQVAKENADVATVTTTAGAGLADNEYSRFVIAANKDMASALNEVGKKLGVRIEFVDSVMGGQANGQYIKDKNLIQIAADSDRPIREVVGHEITHRMQDLAPEEYRAFRKAAIEQRMAEYGVDDAEKEVSDYIKKAKDAGVELTRDEAMDEIAADFAGRMIEDTDLFAQFAKDNRTAAQKLLDSLKEFIDKVKAIFTGKSRNKAAQDAYGKNFGELETVVQEWQSAFDAAEQQAEKASTATGEGGGARYQIRMEYAQEIDDWAKDGKPSGETFVLGSTGPVLQGLGAIENDIFIDSGKINKILVDHPEMTLEEIKRIPQILENPVVVLKSKTAANSIVVIGTYRAKNGNPILAAMNLFPTENRVVIDGMQKVASTYTKTGRNGLTDVEVAKAFLDTSEVLYIDKKRATPVLRRMGYVTPISLLRSGYIGSIALQNARVNIKGVPFGDVVGENVNGKFSLKAYSEAEKKDHVKSAKAFFGKTYNWNETGYITTDGTKLDFSGRHDGGPGGYRTVDHRDIRDALGDDYGGEDYSGAMVQFMGEGNIRISPESGGINLSVMPTKAQLDTLSDFIGKQRGEVILDLDDTNGNTLSSTEYPRGTHSSKVINDIKAFFENGTTPQVSELSRFRYQLRSTAEIDQEMRDLKRERTILASRNSALEKRVETLKGEMRISKEPSVVQRDVQKLGREIIRRYGSDAKYADIENDLAELGKAIMKKDVSMADLMPYAKRAATSIVDNTVELTEYGAELLEMRDYLKKQHIRFDGSINNYNDFRKSHMGTLKLSKSQGTSVDTIYADLTEMFGEGYFPSDVYTEADKLQQIADVIDGTDAIYENPFESYRDAAIQEIANDIIDGMLSDQVRQQKTFADRREQEKREAMGRVREMLTKERTKRKQEVSRLQKQYAEKTAQGREKRRATAKRAQIAKHTGAISNKLLHPTDKQHIPEELRVLVANLLKNINLESSYSLDENGRRRKNGGGNPVTRTIMAEKLKKAYNDIIKQEGNMVVDPDLLDSGGLLDQLAQLGEKRVSDMNASELDTVWEAIRAIEATLTTYNRTIATEKYESTSEWADRLAANSMSRRRRNRKLSLDMADPYTYFSAYGEAGMQIYRTLRNAQDREHVMLVDVRDSAKRFLDADVYKNRDERHTFTTGSGSQLTLTTGQIMNLYNLAKRGEQAVNHLTNGGIMQPEIKRSKKLNGIDRGTENIPLTVEDIEAITSVLTPEQIKVADGLQKLASTKLAEWGNEASMQVYGYRKFKEEHYWPIKAARDAVSATVEKDADNARSIKNMGSAKALTPNASNALDIGDVYDVFAQNASDMIKYATLLAPMEDINRLYNFRYRDSRGYLTGRNVRQVLSGVYGDAAQRYWENLMRDVQNGMVKNASDTTRAVERIVGNTKGAAVGANLRVVIQQPTAYCRAAVVLDPEYMVKGLTKGVTDGNGWDKSRQWAPIAGIKDTSGFDQGSRYTIAREVYGSEGGVLEWINDKSMELAGKADAVTWGKIWNACEWQVATETNLKAGSDEFYRQVAAVFTDVIDQTQVVDGIMQRTQIMRDSDALTRQATSFMGEPLKSLNIFMRAYDAWAFENNPQKRSNALKKLKRSVAALVVTDVVNALAQSIVDGLRDDDKDKKWAERILEAFTGYSGDEESAGEVVKNVTLGGNLVSNMNPMGRIPYVKDVLSILQGYTVDRMDAAAADDIIRTSKTFIKGLGGGSKTTTAYNLKQVLVMGSKVFGFSVGNMARDVWAAARSIASETGNVRMMFEMEKAIYRMDKSAGNRNRWCELLYRAQKDNDTETARLIYKEMLAHGYEEKDVRQGVEAIMKKEQSVKSVDDLKNRWSTP